MLARKACRRWCSTLPCWLNNGAPVASPPLCLSLLNSGTDVNPPAQNRNFIIKMQIAVLVTPSIHGSTNMPMCLSDPRIWLAPQDSGHSYEPGSSVSPEDQRRTAEAAALWTQTVWIAVASWRIRKQSSSDWKWQNTFSILYQTLKTCLGILDTNLCGRRKLLGKRYHSLPTHTLTGLPSGTEWRVGSLAMRWNSGYRSRGAWYPVDGERKKI